MIELPSVDVGFLAFILPAHPNHLTPQHRCIPSPVIDPLALVSNVSDYKSTSSDVSDNLVINLLVVLFTIDPKRLKVVAVFHSWLDAILVQRC